MPEQASDRRRLTVGYLDNAEIECNQKTDHLRLARASPYEVPSERHITDTRAILYG